MVSLAQAVASAVLSVAMLVWAIAAGQYAMAIGWSTLAAGLFALPDTGRGGFVNSVRGIVGVVLLLVAGAILAGSWRDALGHRCAPAGKATVEVKA